MKHILPFSLLSVLLFSPVIAQDEAEPDPYEWIIETYQFPALELKRGFASEERGELRAPTVPPADASEEEIREFIKKNSSIVTHYLEIQGLSLPKGGLVLYDAETMTLTARLPRIAQASVAFTAEAYSQTIETFVALDPVIVEAPAATLRSIIARTDEKTDHSEFLEELEAEVAAGNAFFIDQSRMMANSGQRAKVEKTEDFTFPTGFVLAPDGTVEYESETVAEGTVWEIDPVVGSDEETIDLNLSLRNNFAPSIRREVPLAEHDGKTVSVRSMATFASSVTSQYTFQNKTARMLGVWKPHVAGQPAADDILRAAFVRADIVRVLPLPNEDLARYLRDHGEAVEPIPEGDLEFKQAAEEIPEGMIVRRFVIPPTFLSMGGGAGGGAAADPFSAPATGEPTFTIKATAKDILRSAGISFPEGSSANYLPATSTLVVRNTPEQIALVESYVMSMVTGVERSIGVTVHLVQAPGPVLREAIGNTRTLANHVQEWERLQQQDGFSILSTNWIEARSGQRAKVETRSDIQVPSRAYLESGKNIGEEADRVAGSLTGEFESEKIGTTLEFDPVLGADGETVDINLAFNYDFAPPAVAGPPEAGNDENNLVLDGPTTRFHRANVTTATTIRSGMYRLLGVWTPEGTPEFDNVDIAQGLFIKVDVVRAREEEE